MASRMQQAARRAGASVVARGQQRTRPQRAVRAEVLRTARPTPSVVRVTFTGPGLTAFPVLGSDQYVRLLLPRPGQAEPLLPPTARWYPELLAMDPVLRPVLRNYTLRAVRPEQAEVDIDFVLHGGAGPAVTWAMAAAPGAAVGLIEQGVLFAPDPNADFLLLVADDTALPAAAGILALLPATRDRGTPTRSEVLAEVGSAADEQVLVCAADMSVTWLHRAPTRGSTGPPARPGQALLRYLPTVDLPVGRGQAWLAGESAMVTCLRRHLVRERGFAKADITFTGYFRHGRAQYGG